MEYDAKKIIILPDLMNDNTAFENIINIEAGLYLNRICSIDLSMITFVEPYSIINLLLIGRKFLKKTGSRICLKNVPAHIQQYLERAGFYRFNIFTTDNTNAGMTSLKKSLNSKRLVDITEIPGRERECVDVINRVIKGFRERALTVIKNKNTAENIDHYITVISEASQNIFEHSMDSGFLFVQTYTRKQHDSIQLVISDSGIGIDSSFSEEMKVKYGRGAVLLGNVLKQPISSKRRCGYGYPLWLFIFNDSV